MLSLSSSGKTSSEGVWLARKEKIEERKRKQKRSLYFTKYQIYISWSPGESSEDHFQWLQENLYRKVILPFLGYFLTMELHEWLNTRRKWKFKHKNIWRKRVGTNIPVSHIEVPISQGAKLSLSLMQLSSEGHIFLISAPNHTWFEPLDSWLSEL